MFQSQQLDQAVFNQLIVILREMANTSRLYGYAHQVLSTENYQNSRMVQMVQTVIELYQARTMRSSGSTPQQLITQISQQVISVMTANLIRKDSNTYSQLNPHEKAQVDTDVAYASVLDNEITNYRNLLQEEQRNGTVAPRGMGPHVSDRFRNRRAATPPPNITIEVNEPAASAMNVPDVPAHASGRFAKAPDKTTTKEESPMTSQATHAVAIDPNKQSLTADRQVINKDDPMYSRHQSLIKSQIVPLSTAKTHADAVSVLASGIAFNPLELKTPADLVNASEEEVQMNKEKLSFAQKAIIHNEDPFFAMGPQHAALQFMVAQQALGIDLANKCYSYDYRDVQIMKVISPEESKQDTSLFPSVDFKAITTFQELAALISRLSGSADPVDQHMADLINSRATAIVNGFLFFYNKCSVEIDDYVVDINDLLRVLADRYLVIHDNLVNSQKTLTEHILEVMIQEIDTELANTLNKWANIKSPTLRGRVFGTSKWRAAMHLPIAAIELGLEIIPAPINKLMAAWVFLTEKDNELFYNAAADFIERLQGPTLGYETISIYTLDGFEYRVRETGLPATLAVCLMPRF